MTDAELRAIAEALPTIRDEEGHLQLMPVVIPRAPLIALLDRIDAVRALHDHQCPCGGPGFDQYICLFRRTLDGAS